MDMKDDDYIEHLFVASTRRARIADADPLNEPFGMVIVEAFACGTPVISFPEGSASELVLDGKTGFLVDDEAAMGAAVGQLCHIAPAACRAWVAEHCEASVVAYAYERAYRAALHTIPDRAAVNA